MFEPYKNLSGESGVEAYEYDPELFTWIKVQFTDGSIYTYTDDSCGWATVLEMISLAEDGIGLNSYINYNQPPYEDSTY